MEFDIHILVTLVTSILNLILGLLVLARNPKQQLNRILFLTAFSFSLWALALLLYQYPIIYSSYLWIQITFLLAMCFVVFNFIFSYIFPYSSFRRIWFIAGLVTFGYIIFTIWLLFFTKFWVAGTIIDPQKGLQTILGPGYLWWGLISWVFIIWSIVNFFIKSRTANSIQKLQIRYYWVAFTLYCIFSTIPDFIIPLVWKDTR